LTAVSGGRRTCAKCGVTLAYRMRWLPFLAVILLLSAALGAGSALLFPSGAAFLIGPLALLGVLFLGPRFRQLRKV
jgi:hypothetical protein